jgi:stearoyl-CoA desaturase (delta-9 desaturase)
MSKFWERFFHLLTFITQGSSFLEPRSYAILHRMHHAYSDTIKDPHSPYFFKNVFAMMWNTKKIYADFLNRRRAPEKQFEDNYPEWKWLDKIGDSWPIRIAWGVLYSLFYIYFATAWWMFLLLPIHYFIGPIHGAIVNWCGHKYGYTNFKMKDKSKNTLAFDLLLMGELFQNNHHKLPGRTKFAFKWFEFDPTYPIIRFLSFFKIIQIRQSQKKPVPV